MEQPFNLVSNTTLKKNVADYTLIVIGAFLQALSYSLFLAPYRHRFDRGDVGVTCIPRLGGASVLLVCYLRIRKSGGNVPDRES